PRDGGGETPAAPSRTASRKHPNEKGDPGPPSRRRHPPAVPSLTQQFDPSHFGAVARAMAQLDDPGVTAGTGSEARPQVLEEPVGHRPVLDASLHLEAGVQIPAPLGNVDEIGGGQWVLSGR